MAHIDEVSTKVRVNGVEVDDGWEGSYLCGTVKILRLKTLVYAVQTTQQDASGTCGDTTTPIPNRGAHYFTANIEFPPQQTYKRSDLLDMKD